MLTVDGHELAARAIVKDDVEQIRGQIKAWIADGAIDAIITTGGTGLTGRDVTPEAVRPLFEKEIDGFSVLMHMLSYQKIGTSTIQSRALAGVASGTYIFCVPGSPGACKDAWTLILRYQLDFRHRPCNFVEIMPRLMEHIEPKQAQNANGSSFRQASASLIYQFRMDSTFPRLQCDSRSKAG